MNIRSPFFDPTGNVSKPMATLLALFDFHGTGFDAVHRFTQTAWYQAGKLRAEIAEQYPALKTEALPIFRELGLVDAAHAVHMQHIQAAVLGATVTAMRKRLRFLISEFERGVRFTQLFFIASARPLLEDGPESPEALANDIDLPFDNKAAALATLPTNESEAAEWLLHHCTKQFPWQHRVAVVSCPGTANTEQTLQQYLSQVRPTGAQLLVSSQPYVIDQAAAAQMIFPSYCPIEVIGYQAPTATKVSHFLDTIAKTIDKISRHRA